MANYKLWCSTSLTTTGNCGYRAVTCLVLKDKRDAYIDNINIIREFINSDDFDAQIQKIAPDCSVITISQRVANNDSYSGDSLLQITAMTQFMRALAESDKGIFICTPPVYNAAHPSGDSVIMCAMYIPPHCMGHVLVNEAIYRMGSDKTPVHTWRRDYPSDRWNKQNERMPSVIKEVWTCLTKLEPESQPSTEISPTEPSSAVSSVRTVKAAPRKRKVSPSASLDLSLPTAAIAQAADVKVTSPKVRLKVARKSPLRVTKDPFPLPNS